MAGYGLFHAVLATIMLLFLRVRIRSGHVGGARQGEPRIVRLWSDHATGSALVTMAVLMLPGWLA